MTKRFKPAFAVFFLASLFGLPAGAAEALHLCTDAQPHPPYFYADREGSVQLLEKMAAARTGIELDYHPEPLRRCLEDLRLNLLNATAAAAVSDTTLPLLVFPRKGEAIDKQRAIAAGHTVVFRLKGSVADWDGQAFHSLNTRILVPPGMLLMTNKLDQLSTAYDDGASTLSLIAAKLLAHRGELAIGLEYDVADLMGRDEFAGKFEVLPAPFTTTEYYLAFSREFYAKHADQAENMWNAIAATRRSPEFAAALRRENLPPIDLPQSAK